MELVPLALRMVLDDGPAFEIRIAARRSKEVQDDRYRRRPRQGEDELQSEHTTFGNMDAVNEEESRMGAITVGSDFRARSALP
jgi:hypothetical protein